MFSIEHASFLVIGLSSVGVGFGLFGIVMILANIFAGLFYNDEIHTTNTNFKPYISIPDNTC